MRLLLDPHTFVWFAEDSPRLSARARAEIIDAANDIFLSIASVWEMAIKVSVGKLHLSQPVVTLVKQEILLDRIALLPVTLDHLQVIEALPLHHRDPFDRMLVAQAQVEGLTIVSVDPALDPYGISRLW